ncbi:MAG: ABC transporter substrate-binding protein [Methanomassiliicoccales archaeon]|nr:MAG: ABC transporter substrate-binding protein [Methanomassiliicoccales archaeon]
MKKSYLIGMAIIALLVIGSVGTALLMWKDSSKKMDLVITYSNKINYEPFIVAVEKGYFEEENLNITTMVVTGGIQSAEAIMTGAAEVGAMGDAPAIMLLDKNPGARIICRYSGGEGIHRYIGQDYILGPKDLEGKKVGIQMGSSTHGSFLQWMSVNGVNASKVTLVPISPSDMPTAMQTEQIDAMAGSEPWPTNVEKLCGDKVHQIGDSSGLSNTFPMIFMASQKAIQEKGEAVKAAVRALQKAVAFINQNYEESAAICAQKIGLTLEETKKCMNSEFFSIGFNQTDLGSLHQTANFLLSSGKISAIPDFEARMAQGFIPIENVIMVARVEE